MFGFVVGFDDAVEIIRMYGPALVAIAFFIWRDHRREDRLSTRITTLEDEQKKVILPLVQECASVIAQNTIAMQEVRRVLER